MVQDVNKGEDFAAHEIAIFSIPAKGNCYVKAFFGGVGGWLVGFPSPSRGIGL
ncbi:MAG: hypothetical protein AAF915_12615 [Cyanobacteria bacterium P01_D01_bin.50]